MKGYKGFGKGLICRGKQYAENTVFEENGAVICEKGIHFCTNPFEVLNYYQLVDDNGNLNEFAEVEAMAETYTDDHTKYCTTKLKIGAKLSFAGFVKACVDFIFKQTGKADKPGDNVQLAASRCSESLAASGYNVQLVALDCDNKLAASGYSVKLVASGYNAQLAASGLDAVLVASGDYSILAASGYKAQLVASGLNPRLAASGNCSKLVTLSDSAQLVASGDSAQLVALGKDSVICCAGINGMAKAKKGCWITLTEWALVGEEEKYVPICVKTEQVDGERIKEDVYYRLKDGEFVEV